jgi:uncharacterized protein YjbI with pentapeptide repeats
MAQSKTISVNDLVAGLLAGEKDFSGTKLPEGADLAGHKDFGSLNEKMRKSDLRAEPILAEGSDWRGLNAAGFFCQGIKFANGNLQGANLSGADWRRADLSNANLSGANVAGAFLTNARMPGVNFLGANMAFVDLYEANMSGAQLRNADLSGALFLRMSLKEADLQGAKLTRADFYRCDLRGARGLDAALDLASGKFHGTIVTEQDLGSILAAMRESNLFEVHSLDDTMGRPPAPPAR